MLRLERRSAPAGVPQIVIVNLDLWPPPTQLAYRAAEEVGDHETVDDLIEQQTGIRPGPIRPGGGVRIIEIHGVDPADV